jgi:hypothetical protein
MNLKNLFTEKNKIDNFVIDKDYDLTSVKIVSLLISACKKFCNFTNIYLELGVFKGSTLINVAINNKKISCIGVDNFSLFNDKGVNYKQLKKRIKKNNISNIKIINKDVEEAIPFIKRLNKKIGVLFIDASHDYRSQFVTLLKYKEFLSKKCLIIIDDCNYYHVRKATSDFLSVEKNFKLIFQSYSKTHVANMRNIDKKKAYNGFWNGVNVLYRGVQSKKFSKKLYFENHEFELKKIFFNSHEQFRHFYSHNILEIINYVYDFNFKKIKKSQFLKLITSLKIKPYLSAKRYKSHNFY